MILKSTVKMIFDLLMTVVLFLLMTYILIVEWIHEWLGVMMFVLVITHHLLNIGLYKRILKGRYTRSRIFMTILDISLSVIMIISMINGIIMSREVFAFIDISAPISLARDLHMLSAYWAFTLLSIHIGLHFDMIKAICKKAIKTKKLSHHQIYLLRFLVVAFVIYVIYAFIKSDILSYMFLRTHFVFFDLKQPLIFFFGEYLAIMFLWATFAYHLNKRLCR